MSGTAARAADALVVFGVTGDLARKKTFRALYGLEAAGRLTGPIIGVGRAEWSPGRLRLVVEKAVGEDGGTVDTAAFERLLGRLTHLKGGFDDPSTFKELAGRLEGASHPLFYLETPPAPFAPVTSALHRADLTRGGRRFVAPAGSGWCGAARPGTKGAAAT